MKKLLFLILLLLAASDSIAQLTMKYQHIEGRASDFLKKHPDYIALNDPVCPDCINFSCLISETLNPAALGLNNRDYYIAVETYDPYDNLKNLIWYNGKFWPRLFVKMNTASQKVVYFLNLRELENKDLLDFVEIDNSLHFKFYVKYGLSADCKHYARGRFYVRPISGRLWSYVSPKVNVEWTDDALSSLSYKSALRKNEGKRVIEVPSPHNLYGSKGWLMEVKIPSIPKEYSERFGVIYYPKIYLWKDEKHTIPLNVITNNRGYRSNTIDLGIIRENRETNYIYYFLHSSVVEQAENNTALSNEEKVYKVYYTLSLNEKKNYVPERDLYVYTDKGVIEKERPKQECFNYVAPAFMLLLSPFSKYESVMNKNNIGICRHNNEHPGVGPTFDNIYYATRGKCFEDGSIDLMNVYKGRSDEINHIEVYGEKLSEHLCTLKEDLKTMRFVYEKSYTHKHYITQYSSYYENYLVDKYIKLLENDSLVAIICYPDNKRRMIKRIEFYRFDRIKGPEKKHEHDFYYIVDFYMTSKKRKIGRFDEYAGSCKIEIGDQEIKLNKVVHKDVDDPNFYIASKPITKGMWATVMKEKDSHHFSKSDQDYFTTITLDEAMEFVKALNENEKEKGGSKEYYIPSTIQLIQKGIFKQEVADGKPEIELYKATLTSIGLFISAYDNKPSKSTNLYKEYYTIHMESTRYCKGCSYSYPAISWSYDGGNKYSYAVRLMNSLANSTRDDKNKVRINWSVSQEP